MIVIDHGPVQVASCMYRCSPPSSLPSSAAHLPVFPHKEQWPKKIDVRGPAKSQPLQKGESSGRPADGHHPSPTPARISTAAMKSTFCVHHYFLVFLVGERAFSSIRFGGFEETFDIDRRIFSLLLLQKKGEAANEEIQTESTIHGLVVDAESETKPTGKSSRRTSPA
jgi:hypothetical protein